MKKQFTTLFIAAAFLSQSLEAQIFTPTPPRDLPRPQSRPAPKPRAPVPVKAPVKPRPAPPVASPSTARLTVGEGVTDLPLTQLAGIDTYTRSSLPNNTWSSEATIITGGWGDVYNGFLRFDVSHLPALGVEDTVSVRLFNTRPNGNGTPTPLKIYRALTLVTGSLDRIAPFRVDVQTEKWVDVTAYNRWIDIDITDYYRSWKGGTANNGIAIIPVSSNNNFNSFVSNDSTTDPSHRPILRIIRKSSAQSIHMSREFTGTWKFSGSSSIGLDGTSFSVRSGSLNSVVGFSTHSMQQSANCERALVLSEILSSTEIMLQEIPAVGKAACSGYYRAYANLSDGVLEVNWFNSDNGELVTSATYSR